MVLPASSCQTGGAAAPMAHWLCQPYPAGYRSAVDPVEARAGRLSEFEARSSTHHLAGEHHRHQHVEFGEAREDSRLVGHDDLAGDGQIAAYRIFEARGE